MPHQDFIINAGVNQTATPVLNQANISECNLIRYMKDTDNKTYIQKLGGWLAYYASSIGSYIRVLWAWEGLNNDFYVGVGADDSLSVISEGNKKDITPQTDLQNVAVDLSTIAGDSVVTIGDPSSNVDSFDAVFVQTQISVGGLIIYGLYPATGISANNFSVIARDILGRPQGAVSTVNNGGAVPVFNFTNGSSEVNVTLNDHGNVVGDTFPIYIQTSVGTMVLEGNYTVVEVTDSNNFSIIAQTNNTTVNTTSLSGTGSVATVGWSGSFSLPVGTEITISGATPSGFNGTFTVTASTSNTASFVSTATGPQTVAGEILVNSYPLNGGLARYEIYNGIGPLPAGTGYGVLGYGRGGYGTGLPPSSNTGTPITSTGWTAENWGNIGIFCQKDGPIFEWSPESGFPIATIIPNCPVKNHGMIVAMPQRQILAWGSTFNGIQDPLLIRYCDINDYTTWIGTTINQAGSFRIPRGSRVVAMIQGPQQAFALTDLAIWSVQYINLPYVYSVNEIEDGCGLIAQKAICSINNGLYWMSQSQFFTYTGQGVTPIPCDVWDIVFQQLDTDYADNIIAAPNSRFSEVAWYFPTIGSGGIPNTYAKLNIQTKKWDYGSLERTAWLDQSVVGAPLGAGSDFYIYQHEVAPDANGAAMNSWIRTGYAVLAAGDLFTFLDEWWPDMKWGYYNGAQNANILLTFYVKDFPNGTEEVYGPFTLTSAETFINPRLRGRLLSVKIESNDVGTWWRLGLNRYRGQPDGRY